MVERLVAAPPPMPTAQSVSFEYTQTLGRFLQNEAFIVGHVASLMQAEPIEPAHVEITNAHLTRMISSALILGDINLLDHSATWLNGMLKNRGLSTFRVMQFYKTYRQAVERYLGDDSGIIQQWLAKSQLFT
jgi:hypothetical protein